jgi:pimeloyl-ACP methyl ester carboxylesterase
LTASTLRFRSADGLRLVATLRGDRGPCVLLLHGGGQTRHSWRNAALALPEAGFRSLAIDQRGHGDSDWDPSGRYGFDDYGHDVAALAEQVATRLGSRPFAVGASLGGLASLLATGGGAALSGLALVDVTPRLDPAGVAAIHAFMMSRARDGFATVAEAADAVAAYLPHRPRPRSLEGLRKNLRKRADGRHYWHWDPAFLEGPRPISHDAAGVQERALEAARRLRLPTLLVRGRSSELVKEEHAREFLGLAPHAEYVDIADARHMVAGDSNTAFAGAVVGFLKKAAT